MELLEIKAVNYVSIGPIPLQPEIFLKTIKLMLSLQWPYYDRLYSGVGSNPSKKKYPLAWKKYGCKRKTLGRMFYPLFGQGGCFNLASLWFFFYCHKFSRLRELLFSAACIILLLLTILAYSELTCVFSLVITLTLLTLYYGLCWAQSATKLCRALSRTKLCRALSSTKSICMGLSWTLTCFRLNNCKCILI